MRWQVCCALIASLCWALPARADYGAGRISTLSGTVYLQTPGDPDSRVAGANEVLGEGDQLATWDGSGAELQFAGALVELAPDSVLALSQVRSDGITLYLAQGAMSVARLPGRGSPGLTLQGPHIVAELQTAGRVRLSVWPASQQEWLSVRQGRVGAEADQNSLTLYAGQGLQVFQSAAGLATSVTAGEAEDPTDLALLDGNQHLHDSAVVQRLGGDWLGAASLDDQGEWLEVSSVGPLWVPMFVPAGWEPYHQGHWTWNAVWGWTWCDDLPWAWTPYHYGRWIRWNNRWAWSPQGRVPVFSPAIPGPPGVSLPPLPAPWQPGGRRPLAGTAATARRAMPSAPISAALAPAQVPAQVQAPAGIAIRGAAVADPTLTAARRNEQTATAGTARLLPPVRIKVPQPPSPTAASEPLAPVEPAQRRPPPLPEINIPHRAAAPAAPRAPAEFEAEGQRVFAHPAGEPGLHHPPAGGAETLAGHPPPEPAAAHAHAPVSGGARPGREAPESPPNASGGASGRRERGS